MKPVTQRGLCVCLLLCCGSGCARTSARGPAPSQRSGDGASWFDVVERGMVYERRGEYAAAVAAYRDALSHPAGVAPDLVVKAEIAAHNRIATCYRHIRNFHVAADEYRVAVRLGDRKYAPKALAQMRATREDK